MLEEFGGVRGWGSQSRAVRLIPSWSTLSHVGRRWVHLVRRGLGGVEVMGMVDGEGSGEVEHMPELPEVETLRTISRHRLPGRR